MYDEKTDEMLKEVLKALNKKDKNDLTKHFQIYRSPSSGNYDYENEFAIQLINLDSRMGEIESIIYKKVVGEGSSIQLVYENYDTRRGQDIVYFDERKVPQVSFPFDIDKQKIKELFRKVRPIIDVKQIKLHVQGRLPI